MYSLYEPKIIRMLGIIALAAAFMVAAIITINSGIMDGNSSGSSGSVEVLDSAAAAARAEARVETTGTPATGTRTHVVADGDSFYSIARKYNVSISEIQQLNPNVDPQNLTAGLKLSIP